MNTLTPTHTHVAAHDKFRARWSVGTSDVGKTSRRSLLLSKLSAERKREFQEAGLGRAYCTGCILKVISYCFLKTPLECERDNSSERGCTPF